MRSPHARRRFALNVAGVIGTATFGYALWGDTVEGSTTTYLLVAKEPAVVSA